jgi:hypothetical protein
MFPVCSFCGERPVVSWFEGPDFRTSVTSPDAVRSDEAWLACSICLQLVEAEDRDGLARRGAKRIHGRVEVERAVMSARRHQDAQFWGPRTSGK